MALSLICEPRFDIWAVQRLSQHLETHSATVERLTLDLAEVEFVDFHGIRFLQEMSRQGRLHLENVNDTVRTIFEFTNTIL